MKNKFRLIAVLFVLFILTSTVVTQAQVKFGPIAGLNVSNLSGKDADSDGMLIGAHVGAFVNLGITNFLMIEPQLLYSMKGAKYDPEDLRMNWIEVPIWVRYEMESGLNFNVGPYVGILLSADAGDFDFKDNYKSTDFGFGAGIGYQMNGGLGFHLNYNVGMADIGEDVSVTIPFVGTVTQDTNVKNSLLKLSISYMLGGKRD